MKDAAWRETYGDLVPDEVLAGLDARRPAAVQRWEQRLLDGASCGSRWTATTWWGSPRLDRATTTMTWTCSWSSRCSICSIA